MKRQPLTPDAMIPISVADSNGARMVHVIVPPLGLSLAALERAVIQFALERHDGNQSRAARFLQLSRSALLYRMQKYNVVVTPHARESAEREGARD